MKTKDHTNLGVAFWSGYEADHNLGFSSGSSSA